MTRRLPLLLLGLLLLAGRAPAHPLHASSAQADWNRDSRCLEIGIRVYADDLVEALNRDRAAPLSLEKSPAAELDDALRGYFGARFRVITPDGAAVALKWVGRQFEQESGHDHEDEQILWLYVEAPLPAGLGGLRLWHGLLLEHFRDQANTLRVRDGKREVMLAFTRDDGPKPAEFPP
jgi:hypothetical protein